MENPEDNVLIRVEGREFPCSKTSLAEHSGYFRTMFFSNFAERDRNEVTMRDVKAQDFDLWLRVVDGIGVVTDESVVSLLELTQYLGSNGAEQNCVEFLMGPSEKSVKEKFDLGDRFRLEQLIVHILSNIHTTEELKAIAPLTEIPALSNITQTQVLQKCYELMRIPEDYVYQDMLNQALDIVEQEERRRRAEQQQADYHRRLANLLLQAYEAPDAGRMAQDVGQAQNWLAPRPGVFNIIDGFLAFDHQIRNQDAAAQAQNPAQQPGQGALPNQAPDGRIGWVPGGAPAYFADPFGLLPAIQQAQRVQAGGIAADPPQNQQNPAQGQPRQGQAAAQAPNQAQHPGQLAPPNWAPEGMIRLWPGGAPAYFADPFGLLPNQQNPAQGQPRQGQAQHPGQGAPPNWAPEGMIGLWPGGAPAYFADPFGLLPNQQNPAQAQARQGQAQQPGQPVPPNWAPEEMIRILPRGAEAYFADPFGLLPAIQHAQRVRADGIAANQLQNQQNPGQDQPRQGQAQQPGQGAPPNQAPGGRIGLWPGGAPAYFADPFGLLPAIQQAQRGRIAAGPHQNQQNPAQGQPRQGQAAAQAPNQAQHPGQPAPPNWAPEGMIGLWPGGAPAYFADPFGLLPNQQNPAQGQPRQGQAQHPGQGAPPNQAPGGRIGLWPGGAPVYFADPFGLLPAIQHAQRVRADGIAANPRPNPAGNQPGQGQADQVGEGREPAQ